jgi:hypothetical protein
VIGTRHEVHSTGMNKDDDMGKIFGDEMHRDIN